MPYAPLGTGRHRRKEEEALSRRSATIRWQMSVRYIVPKRCSMNGIRHALICPVIICLLASTVLANKKEDESAALIQRAQKLSDFRRAEAPPFRLKANLKITNEDGSIAEGTYSEFRTSNAQWRKELILGDVRWTEVVDGKKRWTVGSVASISDHVEVLNGLFDLPLRGFWTVDKFENRQIDGVASRCFHGGKQEGALSEFCFDRNSKTLLSSNMPIYVKGRKVHQVCVFRNYQQVGRYSVPASYECVQENKLKLEAALVELAFRPEFAQDVFTPPMGSKESSRCSSRVTPPKVVHSEEPRVFKKEGVVTVGLVVGTNSIPRNLTILNSLEASADAEAMRSVQNWRFEPATCDGQPVNIQIAIEVDMHRVH